MRAHRVTAVLLAALPLAARADPASELRAIRQELVALELDRALDLSPDQARALLPILQSAAADQAARRATAQAALLSAMTRARDELRSEGAVSDRARQALATAREAAWGGVLLKAQALRQQVAQILRRDQVGVMRRALAEAQKTGRASWRKGTSASTQLVVRALTSEAFLALLQARAA